MKTGRSVCASGLLALLGASGCAQVAPTSVPPPHPPQAAMTVSSTLTLSGLSPLKLPGSALQLALLTVDDQRCPTDVQCVWAGMATVTIQVSQPGAAPVQLRLYSGTPPGQAMPEQRWAFGRAFTVDTLLPRPLSTRTVAPADWRVTLSVRAEDMPR